MSDDTHVCIYILHCFYVSPLILRLVKLLTGSAFFDILMKFEVLNLGIDFWIGKCLLFTCNRVKETLFFGGCPSLLIDTQLVLRFRPIGLC